MMMRRRLALTLAGASAAGTLAATALARKPDDGTPGAEGLAPLTDGLEPVSPPEDPPDAFSCRRTGPLTVWRSSRVAAWW